MQKSMEELLYFCMAFQIMLNPTMKFILMWLSKIFRVYSPNTKFCKFMNKVSIMIVPLKQHRKGM